MPYHREAAQSFIPVILRQALSQLNRSAHALNQQRPYACILTCSDSRVPAGLDAMPVS